MIDGFIARRSAHLPCTDKYFLHGMRLIAHAYNPGKAVVVTFSVKLLTYRKATPV